MKGIFSSVVVLVAFLSALLVAVAFSSDIQKNYDVVSINAVNDRVFYKFVAIEHSLIRTLEHDLADSFNVTISEGSTNFVSFNVSLPSTEGNFSYDLANLESFAESRLNETNLAIDVDVSDITGCLPLTILPYNITYGLWDPTFTSCGFGSGERDVRISPSGSGPGLNSYDVVVLASNYNIDSGSARWTPGGDCSGGTFNWTVRVVGNNTVYGPVTNMINPDGSCQFEIQETGTANQIISIVNSPSKVLSASVQPSFNVPLITILELNDVAEKLQVRLSPQAIKVRESLFEIERNYTAVIQ